MLVKMDEKKGRNWISELCTKNNNSTSYSPSYVGFDRRYDRGTGLIFRIGEHKNSIHFYITTGS